MLHPGPLLLAYDGALPGTDVGFAVVVANMLTGAFFVSSVGFKGCGYSAIYAEWLGRILGL